MMIKVFDFNMIKLTNSKSNNAFFPKQRITAKQYEFARLIAEENLTRSDAYVLILFVFFNLKINKYKIGKTNSALAKMLIS